MNGTLHFKIHGEFLTNLARNLWAEGECSKAIGLLSRGIIGFTEELALAVCTGRKKLVGVNNLRLVKDNAKRDNRGLHLPKSVAEMAKLKDDEIETLRHEKNEIVSSVSQRFDRIEKDVLDSHSDLQLMDKLQQSVGPGHPQKPTTEFTKWDNGWLSPDGKLYPCEYQGHIALAENLGLEGTDIEDAGWIKLQDGGWLYPFYLRSQGVTQAQLDTLFDWHRANKINMKPWMKLVE